MIRGWHDSCNIKNRVAAVRFNIGGFMLRVTYLNLNDMSEYITWVNPKKGVPKMKGYKLIEVA